MLKSLFFVFSLRIIKGTMVLEYIFLLMQTSLWDIADQMQEKVASCLLWVCSWEKNSRLDTIWELPYRRDTILTSHKMGMSMLCMRKLQLFLATCLNFTEYLTIISFFKSDQLMFSSFGNKKDKISFLFLFLFLFLEVW